MGPNTDQKLILNCILDSMLDTCRSIVQIRTASSSGEQVGSCVTAMTSVTGNRGRAGSGLAPLVYSLAHGAASQLLHLNLG